MQERYEMKLAGAYVRGIQPESLLDANTQY